MIEDFLKGNWEGIKQKLTIDGREFYAWYTHLSERNVTLPVNGSPVKVKEGQQLGLTGRTDNALDITEDAAHLHFAISKDLHPTTGNRAGAEAVGANRFEVQNNSWVNPTYLMQNLNKKLPDNRTEVK